MTRYVFSFYYPFLLIFLFLCQEWKTAEFRSWAELEDYAKANRGKFVMLRKKTYLGEKIEEQVEQSSDNRCVLWRTARVLVFESSFKWHTFLFLMLFCSNLAHFTEIQLVCDGPTDRRTDRRTNGPTDGRTDTPSYRDARTHLKRRKPK